LNISWDRVRIVGIKSGTRRQLEAGKELEIKFAIAGSTPGAKSEGY
jgi:hypothetical protein